MAKKILVPVFPSEWFYDAVHARRATSWRRRAASSRSPSAACARPRAPTTTIGDGRPGELDVVDQRRRLRRQGPREVARAADRGARGGAAAALPARRRRRADQLHVRRQAEHEGGAQAIADEAAAGAYDMVVLSHGYFDDEVNEEESTPARGRARRCRRSARVSLRGLLSAAVSALELRRLPSGSRRSGSRGRRR